MTARSTQTRERILSVAEKLILHQGFTSTGIDDILEKAAITKSGFFYHFATKNDLAKALVERYLQQDEELFAALLARAEALSEDPLQQLLLFLKLFAEAMETLEDVHPGCLVVTFTYENYQVDEAVDRLVKQGVLSWRKMIGERLQRVIDRYPPRTEVVVDALADAFTVAVEGGILLSRMFESNHYLARQILIYRQHLRFVFGDLF